jgi:hypothetical protein
MSNVYLGLGTLITVAIVMMFAHRIMGVHPDDFFTRIMEEFRQLANRKWTSGSLNAAGLLFTFAFGFVLLIANDLGALFAQLVSFLGTTKAQEYAETVSFSTLYYFLVTFAAFSVFMTALREMR